MYIEICVIAAKKRDKIIAGYKLLLGVFIPKGKVVLDG